MASKKANKTERLTQRKIEGYELKEKVYDVLDTEARGLRLRVHPSGLKCWYHRGRCNGRPLMPKLGEYHRKHYNLEKARKRSAEIRAAFLGGSDPTVADVSLVKTLGDLWNVNLSEARSSNRKASGIAADELNWNTFLKPWQHRPLSEITSAEVRALLGRIAGRKVKRTVTLADGKTKRKRTHGGPTAANRVRSLLSSMWRFADGPDHPPSPCTKSVPARPEVGRKTYVPPDQLKDFLKAVKRIGGDFADVVLIGLLTGLRRANLIGLRWEWVGELIDDGRVWTVRPDEFDGKHPGISIPAEFYKGGRVHAVALVPEAVKILQRRRVEHPVSVFVFPSDRSDSAHLQDLRAGWSKLTSYLIARDANDNPHPDPRPGFHALRHTLGLRLSPVIRVGVLGHSMRAMFGEAATYGRVNPEDYRAALESAAAAMLNDVGEVVPIGKGRREAG